MIRFFSRGLFLSTLILVFTLNGFAHEGMWIPSTLAKLVAGDMKDAGLKLSPEEIYSINNSSLKDAIVHFGGGCTASVISDKGLILTNHHCGYSQIQYHSSLENDYLKNGYWAKTLAEELANPNLTATFVIRIEDVTKDMLSGLDNLDPVARNREIARRAGDLEIKAVEGTHYKADVKPFFYGNAYYMIVTETFNDVRLVGAPPSSIGKFGGDTDNWEWPRHTGDFSLFRIYAGENNAPADYSTANNPLKPKYNLSVNMDGLKEGDFTMVFGFPGTTQQYITSGAVRFITEVENPARIAMRKASLGVIDRAMETSDKLRIQYAAKQSRISNAYKKWIGQNMGLERFDAVAKKQALEDEFVKAARSKKGAEGYANLPMEFQELYDANSEYSMGRTYLIEFFYYGPEALRFSNSFSNLIEHYDSLESSGELSKEIERLEKYIEAFEKDYDPTTDRNIMKAQLPIFSREAPKMLNSQTLNGHLAKTKSAEAAAEAIYAGSVFDNPAVLKTVLAGKKSKMLKTLSKDPIYLIAQELLDSYDLAVRPGYNSFYQAEADLMGIYMKGLMEMMPDNYWPDANSTMRLTFGKMEGSEPQDGLAYQPYTTLDGIMQKYIPGDKEFDVPEKLIELHRQKDFGPYATNGELRVCFLGSNHTTGGNSGSPALNDRGHLVGLNFDRTWESTMSDIMFNGEICRNIMVDIKYVLFIVDKLAGAGHLVEEMDLVNTENSSSEKAVEQKEAGPVAN